jgi:hypothetical protein
MNKPIRHMPWMHQKWVSRCRCGWELVGDDFDEALSELQLHQTLFPAPDALLTEVEPEWGEADDVSVMLATMFGDLQASEVLWAAIGTTAEIMVEAGVPAYDYMKMLSVLLADRMAT